MRVDPNRIGIPIDALTGVIVEAEYAGLKVSADMAILDDESLTKWVQLNDSSTISGAIRSILSQRRP